MHGKTGIIVLLQHNRDSLNMKINDIALEDLSLDELYAINDKVCTRIEQLHKAQDKAALDAMTIGMTVQFKTKQGVITGTLAEKGDESVVINSEDGKRQFKVAAGLVKPVLVG